MIPRRDSKVMEPNDPLWRVTDVQTTAEAAHEDVAALYARTCPRLVGLLVSIGGSRSEAEEVAQDAYVRLLQHWGTVRDYDDPESWVRVVAVRLLISRRRRATAATFGLRRLAGRARQHQPEQPELSADALAVTSALRTLPVAQRACVILHHAMDLSVEQVAQELKVPVGTVKSRLSRARAALAPLLNDHEEVNHV